MVLELVLAAVVQNGAVTVEFVKDPTEAARIAAALEGARMALPAFTGARDVSIRAAVAESVDAFVVRTGLPRTAAAGVVDGAIIFSPVTARLEDLREVARHEVAHLLVLDHAGPGLPRWLAEGLSAELAGESPRGDAPCSAFDRPLTTPGAYAVAQRAVRAAARAAGGIEALWGQIDRRNARRVRCERCLIAECAGGGH